MLFRSPAGDRSRKEKNEEGDWKGYDTNLKLITGKVASTALPGVYSTGHSLPVNSPSTQPLYRSRPDDCRRQAAWTILAMVYVPYVPYLVYVPCVPYLVYVLCVPYLVYVPYVPYQKQTHIPGHTAGPNTAAQSNRLSNLTANANMRATMFAAMWVRPWVTANMCVRPFSRTEQT